MSLFDRLLKAEQEGREKGFTVLSIFGLDNAGKTTLFNRLKSGEFEHVTPTLGVRVGQLRFRDTVFRVWDVGGQPSFRGLW